MSAIFGLFHRDREPCQRAVLQRMDRAVEAFGPDGQGLALLGCVGLGHRLMAFTPEDRFEQQPVAAAEGQVLLVFDGRLDNRPELAAALGIPAHEARTLPDSAFVARAYLCWGEDCPRRLIGPHAFVVWDAREQRLFAARAPFAAPVLHYVEAGCVFAFCSRPRGLFASGLLSRQIDPEYLADHLLSLPHDAGSSFFKRVRSLDAGHSLSVSPGLLRCWPHWDAATIAPIRHASNAGYVDNARALFDRVIADQLRSATPVGVMMSGGLDSTAIAGSAALHLHQQGQSLAAFTEVPSAGWQQLRELPGRYYDEAPLAREMAALHDNLQLHFVEGDGYYLDGIEPLFDAAEYPFTNASNRRWWERCIGGAAAQGQRVLLTGIGGNLTLGWGGDQLLTELLRAGRWVEAWRSATRIAAAASGPSPMRRLVSAAVPFLPLGLRRLQRRRRLGWPLWSEPALWHRYSPVSDELVGSTRVEERARAKGFTLELVSTLGARQRRVMALQGLQIEANMDAGYRQLIGVELRHPLLDQRLIEQMLAFPTAAFVADGLPRSLIRGAMSGRVPETILNNRRRGLQGAQWLERLHAARPRIEADLAAFGQSALVASAIDLPRLRQLLQAMPAPQERKPGTEMLYRRIFEFGMMTSRFLQWTESNLHGA